MENRLKVFRAMHDLSQEDLAKAVKSMGWDTPMPVQAKAIPILKAGLDLIVQSKTGSGKTGAFLLPVLHLHRVHLVNLWGLV